MSLKNVKAKIKAVNKTGQVTKAMEAVSAAKMRKTQEWALNARPYAYSAVRILKKIVEEQRNTKHMLLMSDETRLEKPLFVVLTSDRGLAGSLNASILRELGKFIKDYNHINSAKYITYGKKGTDFIISRKYTVLESNPSLPDKIPIETIRALVSKVIDLINTKEIDSVFVIYNNFISTFYQEPAIRQVFPVSFFETSKILEGIRPLKGKYAELFFEGEELQSTPYLFEPNVESVLDNLLPFLGETIIFHGALESKASEHSARMVAMKSARDKANELVKDLTRDYNKERQSMITREMSEIIGGIEAIK